MEEKNITKITDMLLTGGRMLSIHCNKCRSPLFEYQGKLVCPMCGEIETKAPPKKVPPPKVEAKPASEVESVLRQKLDWLTDELRKETDHSRISELLQLIKSTLEVLGRMKG